MTSDEAGKSYDPQFRVWYRDAESILRHPDFPRAREVYVDRVLALYANDVFLNKLLMEAARMVIFAVVICLEAGHRAEDRATWPTLANIKKAVALFSLASPRRVEHIVGRLIQTGYLESRPAELDRRARLLIPTAEMIAHDQAWLSAHYAPLAILFGDSDYRLPLGADRSFQRTQRRFASDFFVQSAMVLLRNPHMMLFLARDGGVFVLLQLVKASLVRDTPTVPMLLGELGRNFAVSRTHVRQLLTSAEERGLVEMDRKSREITLRPGLLESLDRFIAEGMSNHDLTGAAARRELSA